jgi:catechol 2,3-dioxygenase-like lactoylglutathione lyase family enzyme
MKLSILAILTPLVAAAGLNAVGIQVADLKAAEHFYTTVLGFQYTGISFEFDGLSERILKLPGKDSGAALVLMKTAKGPQTPPGGKIVLEVANVKATVDKVRAYGKGANVTLEPGSFKMKNGATLPTAFIKDLDGWDVELNPIGLFG